MRGRGRDTGRAAGDTYRRTGWPETTPSGCLPRSGKGLRRTARHHGNLDLAGHDASHVAVPGMTFAHRLSDLVLTILNVSLWIRHSLREPACPCPRRCSGRVAVGHPPRPQMHPAMRGAARRRSLCAGLALVVDRRPEGPRSEPPGGCGRDPWGRPVGPPPRPCGRASRAEIIDMTAQSAETQGGHRGDVGCGPRIPSGGARGILPYP